MVDFLYKERAHLVAFLAASYPSTIRFDDVDYPEYGVVYVQAPKGQMSWHIHRDDLHLFKHVDRERRGIDLWDGHTTPEKYERLKALTKSVSETQVQW